MELGVVSQPKRKPENHKVYLMIKKYVDDVIVYAVDEYGHDLCCANRLLRITSDGKVEMETHVDETLGFQLDGRGRIKLDG